MEKIISVISSIENETNKTLYVALTDNGKIFVSYNLNKWELVKSPDFSINKLKERESKLNG